MKRFVYMGPNKQNVSGMSYKIWKIARTGRRIRTQWGPATIDQATRQVIPIRTWQEFVSPAPFPSETAARADEKRRVKEKLGEGYKRISGSRKKRSESKLAPARSTRTTGERLASPRRSAKRPKVPRKTRKTRSPLIGWSPALKALPALSLRQPWAWLVVNGYKDIENRSWKTNRRGPLLIHASATKTDLRPENFLQTEKKYGVGLPDSFHIGRIIGVVDLVDCVRTHSSKWKIRNSWGWVLKNPRRLPERDYKGSVGIFYPDFKRAG